MLEASPLFLQARSVKKRGDRNWGSTIAPCRSKTLKDRMSRMEAIEAQCSL
jgi:hypothetical protein